jgi:hypothetical protein
MPKRKRRTAAAEAAPVTNSEATATLDAVQSEPPPVAEASEPEMVAQTSPAVEQPAAETRRGRFRSWVVDSGRGYTRLTDVDNHCIVLQFNEKPNPDVLEAVRGAGFQFRSDYHGQQNCWVRVNNFEGRQHVESIERLIGIAIEGRASAVC